MIKMYYRGVAVAMVVYDVGDRASFECIGEWLGDVREKQQSRALGNQKDGVIYYVIGNKCDLDDDDREVSYEEGQNWVKEYKQEVEEEESIDIKFLEVSAKEGTNINALFEEISVKLLERHNKAMGLKGDKNRYKMNDPTASLAYNYDHQKMQQSFSGKDGPGANRIEIVDMSEKYRKAQEKKAQKEQGCCKSC